MLYNYRRTLAAAKLHYFIVYLGELCAEVFVGVNHLIDSPMQLLAGDAFGLQRYRHHVLWVVRVLNGTLNHAPLSGH